MTRTIRYEAMEASSAREAIQIAAIHVDTAILLDGRPIVVDQETADEFAEAGVEFAYLHYHEPTERIMTVPVN